MSATTVATIEVNGLTLGYREAGEGEPVLLLHGWPTSSFLYRDVIAPIARGNRVLALDMPGFGASSKPVDVRYTFDFFGEAIDGFLDALGVERFALVGHDLGGPIAVDWLLRRPGRVTCLALLNTLLYPDFDPMVLEFVTRLTTPGLREETTSDAGLEDALRLGLADGSSASPTSSGASSWRKCPASGSAVISACGTSPATRRMVSVTPGRIRSLSP